MGVARWLNENPGRKRPAFKILAAPMSNFMQYIYIKLERGVIYPAAGYGLMKMCLVCPAAGTH
jgi:hypothetical protein